MTTSTHLKSPSKRYWIPTKLQGHCSLADPDSFPFWINRVSGKKKKQSPKGLYVSHGAAQTQCYWPSSEPDVIVLIGSGPLGCARIEEYGRQSASSYLGRNCTPVFVPVRSQSQSALTCCWRRDYSPFEPYRTIFCMIPDRVLGRLRFNEKLKHVYTISHYYLLIPIDSFCVIIFSIFCPLVWGRGYFFVGYAILIKRFCWTSPYCSFCLEYCMHGNV